MRLFSVISFYFLVRWENKYNSKTKKIMEDKILEIIKDESEKADVREHTCVGGIGYSQFERNIAERVIKEFSGSDKIDIAIKDLKIVMSDNKKKSNDLMVAIRTQEEQMEVLVSIKNEK